MKKIPNRIPLTEIEKRVEVIANSVLEDSFPTVNFNNIPKYKRKSKPNVIREIFSTPANLREVKEERERLRRIGQEIKNRNKEVRVGQNKIEISNVKKKYY